MRGDWGLRGCVEVVRGVRDNSGEVPLVQDRFCVSHALQFMNRLLLVLRVFNDRPATLPLPELGKRVKSIGFSKCCDKDHVLLEGKGRHSVTDT